MNTPPPIDLLRKLQLFRSMIVNFVNMPDFSDMVVGCFARVLLETRHEDSRRDADHYYIACIKGAQKGPRYTGFSAETMTTEWHIIVELPPCFRSTQNGNVVQLNSISNSPFRNTEYDSWVETRMHQEGMHFPSLPQLQFRLSLLQQQKQHAFSLELQRPRNGEDAEAMEQLRAKVEREVLETHLKLPMIDQLRSLSMTELREIELQVSDILTYVRVLVNEKIKCVVCRSRVSTEVCYPCKHQVLCKACAEHINNKCPAPNCNVPVRMTFEPYSS